MKDKMASSVSKQGSKPEKPAIWQKEDYINLSKLEEELLSLLIGRELYGLQIIQAFAEASQGNRQISIGTLYPTLSRMEEKGLVSSRMENRPSDDKGGARRKYFKITREGMFLLAEAENFRKHLSQWQPSLAL